MSLTITSARDEILTLFRTTWLAAADSTNVPLLWDNRAQDIPTSGSFARVSVRHADGAQATLSGETGLQSHRLEGTVFVQVFTPTGDGLTTSDKLVEVAMSAFQGKRTAGGVWFRRVRAAEIGPDGAFFQVNVLADFEYDEVR